MLAGRNVRRVVGTEGTRPRSVAVGPLLLSRRPFESSVVDRYICLAGLKAID